MRAEATVQETKFIDLEKRLRGLSYLLEEVQCQQVINMKIHRQYYSTTGLAKELLSAATLPCSLWRQPSLICPTVFLFEDKALQVPLT